MQKFWIFVTACLLLGVLTIGPAMANDVIVGINMVNPERLSIEQQNAILAEMKSNGVRVIRCGITPEAANHGIDFAKRVYAQGMKIELGVSPQYRSDAPTRQWQPDKFPDMWAGHPLSSADPEQFRAFFQPLLAKLEDAGIILAGIELGNEINWTAFNAEFPLPGEGKGVLNLDDLYHDPEGQQIAKGYLQYLKVLAVLKDIRDHSRFNQRTPIISAGLIDAEQGDIKPGSKVDAVSFSATLDFMRANGLDKLVDGYGIHIYPNPNPQTPPMSRIPILEQQTFASECLPTGSAAGKPCWVTEWGIPNKDTSCPPHEDGRAFVIRQMLDIFRQYAQQGRLVELLYFAWNTDAWSKQVDPFSVYRCGALTDSGKLVLSPM